MSGGGFAGPRVKRKLSSALVVVVAAGLLAFGLPGLTPAASAATTPAFVQQASARRTATTATVTPTANVTAGNRLVVEVGVWNASRATASGVTDSAGNTYTKVTSFAATDDTEMSIWTAPITNGGGTRPVVTARVTSSADIGVAVLEYSGLSSAAGLGSVDAQNHAVGKTAGAAATVSSGATPATTAPGELALGFYVDSGFGTALVGGTGYTVRTNVSPNNTMDLLVEEQLLPAAGATPNATARTGANTHWLMATVVFQAGGGTATAPSAAHGRSRHGRQRQRHGQLDGTGRRRQHDHQLHRHALRRNDGTAHHHPERRARRPRPPRSPASRTAPPTRSL